MCSSDLERILQVIIDLSKPLTEEEAKAQYKYNGKARPASWNKSLPILIKAVEEVDAANPRSVESARLAAEAMGEAKLDDALQPLIDATPTGGTLTLEAKVYAAPGKISRSMRIEGVPGTVVDGGGIGSILTVLADDVSIVGLTLRNSGDRHETTDSAVRLRGKHGIMKDNVIEDCLFEIGRAHV